MAIPESQLETWSHQGAVSASADTHKSIRAALDEHNWPTEMANDAYLQGSYPNFTNIRGNSDVDLVVSTDSVFYSNLTQEEKDRLCLKNAGWGWSEFRSEVLSALRSYYGGDQIDDSRDKCIRVLPSDNRLSADVVPCVQYSRYDKLAVVAQGVTFWTTTTNTQVINYPKLHITRGADKNKRVGNLYKPAIRMFKNARDKIPLPGGKASTQFPSYFLECLLYNVRDDAYRGSFADIYVAVARYLAERRDSNKLSEFVTQSHQQWLFGPALFQWNETAARLFINEIINLWNNW